MAHLLFSSGSNAITFWKSKGTNFPLWFFIDGIELFFLTYDTIEKEVLLQMSWYLACITVSECNIHIKISTTCSVWSHMFFRLDPQYLATNWKQSSD
jgi:hypothetical protein